jgi:hypothetical protein
VQRIVQHSALTVGLLESFPNKFGCLTGVS